MFTNNSSGCLEDGPLDLSLFDGKDVSCVPTPKFSSDKPTLHEILIAEKLDFEMKVQRATRRKKWLKGTLVLFQRLMLARRIDF